MRVEADAEPALEATAADDEGGLVHLEALADASSLEVRRPADAEGQGPRIRVEVVVTPGQLVSLEGRDLVVAVRGSISAAALADEELESADGEEEGSVAVEAAAEGASSLRLAVEGAQVDLAGIRNATVEARRSSLWSLRTHGLLTVTLDDGSAEVRGHQGDLRLEATDSEVRVSDFRGKLEPRLAGGSLDVRQGIGVFESEVADAFLLFDGWRGYVTLLGTGTTVEARGADQPHPWKIDGEDLQVTLEGFAGPVAAELDGGRFQASSMHRMIVTATHRADVELTDLEQGVELKLAGGATARLTDVAGKVQAEVNDAELTAERIGQLSLTGVRSEVDVGAVARLLRLEMTDSNLALDLTSTPHSSALKLLGEGRTAVRLPAPCIVRIAGPSAAGRSVDVTGCDLRLPDPAQRTLRSRFIHGSGTVTLTVSLDDGVQLEVEGEP